MSGDGRREQALRWAPRTHPSQSTNRARRRMRDRLSSSVRGSEMSNNTQHLPAPKCTMRCHRYSTYIPVFTSEKREDNGVSKLLDVGWMKDDHRPFLSLGLFYDCARLLLLVEIHTITLYQNGDHHVH